MRSPLPEWYTHSSAEKKLPRCLYGMEEIGIGKTYAYLTACVLLKKFVLVNIQPVVISISSVALQKVIVGEYLPFLSRILLENHVIEKSIPS